MLHGAHVQGFDFLSPPSLHRFGIAARGAFADILLHGNGLLPVCLSVALAAASAARGERILAGKWLAACFAALTAGIAVLGFNESMHYAWIVDNVIPRFVWLCALPLLVSDGEMALVLLRDVSVSRSFSSTAPVRQVGRAPDR